MKGDHDKHGMCHVDFSVVAMATCFVSDSTTRKCGIFNLNTINSASGIQKECINSECFSITVNHIMGTTLTSDLRQYWTLY